MRNKKLLASLLTLSLALSVAACGMGNNDIEKELVNASTPAPIEEIMATATPDVTKAPVVTEKPTTTEVPAATSTEAPTEVPKVTEPPVATSAPTAVPTTGATKEPAITATPTVAPAVTPTKEPVATVAPTAKPTVTPAPTVAPTAIPTSVPTEAPTAKPVVTPEPTAIPTEAPTAVPTSVPTEAPTPVPTAVPTPEPTAVPTPEPTPEVVCDHSMGGSVLRRNYLGTTNLSDDGCCIIEHYEIAYNCAGPGCDYVWVEMVDKDAHAGGHDIRGYSATCTEDGLSTGWVCSCGEITREQEVIPALGHNHKIRQTENFNEDYTQVEYIEVCNRCDEVFNTWWEELE